MRTKIYPSRFLMLLLACSCAWCSLQAQVSEAWIRRADTYTSNGTPKMRADKWGNIYVTGAATVAGSVDYLTMKYDAQGNLLWQKTLNGPGNSADYPAAIAVDEYGNVYVTGSAGSAYLTVRYNRHGEEMWTRHYKAYQPDEGRAVAVDEKGFVYVTGMSWGDDATGANILTFKYDSLGNEVWRNLENFIERIEYADDIVIDKKGNVFIPYDSYYTGDYFVGLTKIGANGESKGTAIVADGFEDKHEWDVFSSPIAMDDSGNLYVAGRSTIILNDSFPPGDITIVKFSPNLEQVYSVTYNNAQNADEEPVDIAVDKSGNCYVTGKSENDFVLLKVNRTGTISWSRIIKSGAGGRNVVSALALDSAANLYVTGYTERAGNGKDFLTLKYDSSGVQQWQQYYNGPASANDYGTDLIVTPGGDIYVTGTSAVSASDSFFTTIKYHQQPPFGAIRFSLVNAATDKVVSDLNDGDTINLAAFAQINIRANTQPAKVGSVVFTLTGMQNHRQKENSAPYALFANNKTDYYAWAPLPGAYTLTAQAFSESGGTGNAGPKYSIRFYALLQEVKSFTLVDAQKETDLPNALTDNATFTVGQLPIQLNIRANTSPAKVGSVVMQLNERTHTESFAPYALFGNDRTNYYGASLGVGHYTLTATPYSSAKGKGFRGKSHSIRFSILEKPQPVIDAITQNKQADITGSEAQSPQMVALPNPFATSTRINFTPQSGAYTVLSLYDASGNKVQELFAGFPAKTTIGVTLDGNRLLAGVYTIAMVSGHKTVAIRLIRLP